MNYPQAGGTRPIHGPPQILVYALDGQNHLIEVPLVARPWPSTPELISIRLAKLVTPLANRLVGHLYAAFQYFVAAGGVSMPQLCHTVRMPNKLTTPAAEVVA
jgi:hypothetical protein